MPQAPSALRRSRSAASPRSVQLPQDETVAANAAGYSAAFALDIMKLADNFATNGNLTKTELTGFIGPGSTGHKRYGKFYDWLMAKHGYNFKQVDTDDDGVITLTELQHGLAEYLNETPGKGGASATKQTKDTAINVEEESTAKQTKDTANKVIDTAKTKFEPDSATNDATAKKARTRMQDDYTPPPPRDRHYNCCMTPPNGRTHNLIGSGCWPKAQSACARGNRSPAWRFPKSEVSTSPFSPRGSSGSRSPSPNGAKKNAPLRAKGYGIVLGPSAKRGEVIVRLARPDAIPLSVSVKLLKRHTIPGSYAVGDVVESKIDFEREAGDRIEVGDLGIVLGPATRTEEGLNRVCCRFKNMESVNLVNWQIGKSSLPGRFRVNQSVRCKDVVPKVSRRDGRLVRVGEYGVVIGPAYEKPRTHVQCRFSCFEAIDMAIAQIEPTPELTGGFKVNDVIESRIQFQREGAEFIEEGSMGVVIGPPAAAVGARPKEDRIACSFPTMMLVNMTPVQVQQKALPSNYKVNDPVVSYVRLPGRRDDLPTPVRSVKGRLDVRRRLQDIPICSYCEGYKIKFRREDDLDEFLCSCKDNARICECDAPER